MPTLTWIGKEAVQQLYRQVPYRLLRCHDELSVGATADGNLLDEIIEDIRCQAYGERYSDLPQPVYLLYRKATGDNP